MRYVQLHAGVISPYNHIWHYNKVCKFAGGSILKVLMSASYKSVSCYSSKKYHLSIFYSPSGSDRGRETTWESPTTISLAILVMP